MKKHIIFDFDGTIANTEALAYQIYEEVGSENLYPVLPREEFEALKNVSIYEKFKRHQVSIFKLPKLARKAMRVLSQMMDHVDAYPDMADMLRLLHEKQFKLYIVSSNSKKNIMKFLKQHDLNIFTDIYGKAKYFGKEKVLKKLMKKHHLNHDDMIYIGDEVRDIVSCDHLNILIYSASWGFDNPTFLIEKNPDGVVDTVKQLQDKILKHV